MTPSLTRTFDLVIVGDNEKLLHQLRAVLRPAGFNLRPAADLDEAESQLQQQPADMLLLAPRSPRDFNPRRMKQLSATQPELLVVALASDPGDGHGELLRQNGARLVLSQELSARELGQFLVTQAELRQLEEQNYRLRQILEGRTSYENLLGSSLPMRSLYRLLDQIARTDAPALVTGEPGTERVEVAQAIHMKSERAMHPLVVVDCRRGQGDETGAFLFGPIGRGEYASGPHPEHSAFAKAGGGSLVLHQIEALGRVAQKRLLDFLHRPFYQDETPGTPRPLSRLMATADPELVRQVEEGQFLRELFYRINILQIRVPPVRARREDIPLLAQHLLRLESGSAERNGGGLSFSSQALLAMFQYDWPGNLDEMQTMIRTLARQARSMEIGLEDLPEAVRSAGDPPPELQAAPVGGPSLDLPLKEAKRIFETEYFKGLLRRTHGNMTMASRYSRVGRPYLYKKIREYGLEPESFR